MRKITVNIYYRGNVDKQGTAPLLIAVNHASSTCYIPIAGVRLKPNQWDARHKKVVKHPQADTINSVAVTTLGKATEAVMKLGNVRGMTTAKVRDMIAEYIYPSDDIDTGFMAVLQAYMNQCDKPNTADKFKQTQTHIKRWLGSKGARALQFGDIDAEWLQNFDKWVKFFTSDEKVEDVMLSNHGYNDDYLTWTYMGKEYWAEGEFYVDDSSVLHHTFIAPNGKEIEIKCDYE